MQGTPLDRAASSALEEQNKIPDASVHMHSDGGPGIGQRHDVRQQDSGFSREALRPLCLLRRELDPAVTPYPSAKVVRSLCRRIGVVPDEFRARIWSLLLLEGQEGGREEDDRLRQELKDVTFDCKRQQTLEVDLERTRAEEAFFRDPSTRNQIRRFLTLYCKQQDITYKQGLHELVAPFIALQQQDAGLDEVRLFRCFVAFLDLFLKGIYADDEMRKAQCMYQSVRLLLTYHCPTLALHIEHKASLSPELYLTSYVLTLFARSLDLDTTTKLWDQLIVEGECVSPLFVLTALFHNREADLLHCSIEDLPSAVTQLRFQGLVQARALIAHARRLQHDTPHSFCRRLQRLCTRDQDVRQYEALLQDLTQALTLTIHPNEAIRGVTDFLDGLERAMPPTPTMGPSTSPSRAPLDGDAQARRRRSSSTTDKTATANRRRRSSAARAELEGHYSRSAGFDDDDDSVHTRNEEREADEHACFGADAGNGRGVTAAGGTAAALPAYSSRERRAKDRRGHNFIFCDCRPIEEYEAFHLETAGQLDLFVQGGADEDKVTAFVTGLKAWHDIAHICIITAEASVSVEDRDRGGPSWGVGGRVLWALLGMGVCRVSHVQGGMAATLRALETQLHSGAKHRSVAGQAKHRKLQQVLVSSRAMEPARRQNFLTRLFAGSRRSTGGSSGLFPPPPHKARHSDPVNSGGHIKDQSRHRSSFSVLRELDDDDDDTAQALSGSGGKPRRRSRGSNKSNGSSKATSQRVDQLPTRSPTRKADHKVTAFLQFYGGKASLSSASEHSSSEHSSSSDHTDSERTIAQSPPIARHKPPAGKDASPSPGTGLFWLPRRKSDVPSGSRAAPDPDSPSAASRALTGDDATGPEGRHSTGSMGPHAPPHAHRSASSLFGGSAFSGPGSGGSILSYILPADKDKDKEKDKAGGAQGSGEAPEGHRAHGSGVSRTSSQGSTPWWSFNRSSSSSSTLAPDGLPATAPDDSLNPLPPDNALSPPTLPASASLFSAFADAFSTAAPSSPPPPSDPTHIADTEARPNGNGGQSRLLAGFFRLMGSNSPQRSSSFGEVGDGTTHTHDESYTEELGSGEALVDVRPYLERASSEGRAYFPARRLLPNSGQLSHCVIVVTNNTILQGVEVSGRPGFIRKVDEQDISKLVKVTRRKSQAENLRLHFDDAGPTGHMSDAPHPVAPPPSSTAPPSRHGSLSSRVMEVYCPEIQEVVAVLSGKIEELRSASLSSVDALPFSPASPAL